MKISLIICTRNRPEILLSNLDINIKEFSDNDEILIVDGSDNNKQHDLYSPYRHPNVIFYYTSPGLPAQRNFGIEKSKGDILLFLDDDIRLDPGSIDKLRSFFLKETSVDAITGRLIEKYEPSKQKQLIEMYFSRIFFTPYFGKAGFTKSGLPVVPLSNEPYHKSGFMRGGFSAYRHKVFVNHRFDEYFNGYAYLEDTDFSLSILNEINSVFLPEFSGIHDHLSTLQKDHSKMREQYIENYYYIFNKYSIGKKSLFLRSITGILLINLIKSIGKMNFSFFSGTVKGIIKVVKK